MQNEYTEIVAGMTGAQLIDALNGNSNISKTEFESIIATIATLVLGNNIKQIRVDDGGFQYTLDGTNWYGVDNNVWGSITGTLSDQTDLKNALDEKATNAQLQQVSNSLGSLSNTVSGLSTTVGSNTSAISANTTAIGQLQTKQAKQVSSDTIVAIRLGSGGFLQYSVNGTSWQNVQSIAEIDWGAIGGEISNQVDLQEAFNSKANVSTLNSHISNTDNPHQVTKSQVGLGNVDNTSDENKPISTATQEALDVINGHITELTNNKIQVTEEITGFEYLTLQEYNYLKDEGALSDTTIYFVK